MSEKLMIYPKTLVTGPEVEPFEVADIKLSSRVDGAADDDLLADYILAARVHTEQITARALIAQAWDVFPQCWPGDGVIALPFGRLLSVDAFEYSPASGSAVAWDIAEGGNDLELDGEVVAHIDRSSDWGGRIVLAHGNTWPTATLKTSNPIRIRITVGYGEAATDIPGPVRTYVRLVVADLYENRESVQLGTGLTLVELPIAEALLANYRKR